MGLTETEFLDMTPRQFFARQRADVERERRGIEVARISAFLVASVSGNLKKGTSMRKFWPLPWDTEAKKIVEQSEEEARAFKEGVLRLIAQQHGNNSGT